jgi:endonuclease III-like uncharacterized protein
MIAGAYLTQNTAWTNVERALANLRQAGVLSVTGIRRTPLAELERLIRPAGYFRQKAQRLKTFVAFLDKRYHGSFRRMFAQSTAQLRQELLALNGVGPETADSILLYAGNHPVFVVDSYTRRILERHDILPSTADYEEIRELFQQALAGRRPPAPPWLGPAAGLRLRPEAQDKRSANETARKRIPETWNAPGAHRGAAHLPSPMSRAKRAPQAQVFNEMHALLVGVAKNHCHKSKAQCEECPLKVFLPAGTVSGRGVRQTKKLSS